MEQGVVEHGEHRAHQGGAQRWGGGASRSTASDRVPLVRLPGRCLTPAPDGAPTAPQLPRELHLDSLAERLREPRVRAVIDPMLSGHDLPSLPPDDVRYVKDLGLVRESASSSLEVANPIYREIGIEVKTRRDRDKRGDPVVEGVPQLEAYLARVGAERGWLVVFDQRTGAKGLPERALVEHGHGQAGRKVAVVRR